MKQGGKQSATISRPPKWKTPEEAYSAALTMVESGNDEGAIAPLQYSIGGANPFPKGFFLLGRALAHLGRYAEARVALTRFAALAPDSPQLGAASKLLKDLDTLEATRFRLTSRPPGAVFSLDTFEGETVTAPGDLPATPGPHTLIASLAGYESATVEAVAALGEPTPVTVTLVPFGCDLRASIAVPVTSATVTVDAAEPVAGPVRVRPGPHQVVIVPTGGAQLERQVTCQDHEPLSVEVSVPAPTEGKIALSVSPQARVLVDGKQQPNRDGHALVTIKAGEHLVDVEVDGKVPWHASTMVHAGELTDLVPVLEPGGGATGIEVRAWPQSASIVLDLRPVKSGEVVRLEPGLHTVKARAFGYVPQTRTIEVLKGERSHVEVRLEARGRFLFYLGLAAIPVALAAEGLGLVGHVNAQSELAGTPPYERWHALEVSGHVVAGVGAAVVVGSLLGFFLQRRGDNDAPVRVGAAVDGHGGALVVSGRY